MSHFKELHYWNTNSYGQALRIRKNTLRTTAAIFCILTPFTNWLLPFISKTITQDFILRYNKYKP